MRLKFIDICILLYFKWRYNFICCEYVYKCVCHNKYLKKNIKKKYLILCTNRMRSQRLTKRSGNCTGLIMDNLFSSFIPFKNPSITEQIKNLIVPTNKRNCTFNHLTFMTSSITYNLSTVHSGHSFHKFVIFFISLMLSLYCPLSLVKPKSFSSICQTPSIAIHYLISIWCLFQNETSFIIQANYSATNHFSNN